jgi:hypothetical protein
VVVPLLAHGIAVVRFDVGVFRCKRGQGGVGDGKMLPVPF